MPSSSTPAGSGAPRIPPRTTSNMGRESLERDHALLYWASAAAACDASIHVFEAETKLAIRRWIDEDEGPDARSWWATQEARRIIEKIKAATYEKRLYSNQADQIERGGPIRRAFQAMFTTSQMGICADKVGMGPRTRSEQSKFKKQLITKYNAATTRPNKPKVIVSLHDSATGLDLVQPLITAAHLVPHRLGPDILVALFGVNVEGELYTALNGLLLHVDVERALDDGAIAIVPDLPDDPSTEQIADWEKNEPKNYRWRVIDDNAESLDTFLVLKDQGSTKDITIRDLDGQQLSFKNNQRPRARYLYFFDVVAQLKMAWRHDYRKDPINVFKSQLGKGFWATRGRYLNRALLLALAEEIGHNTGFPKNIPPLPGNDNDKEELDRTGLVAITKIIQAQRTANEEEEEEEGS
ncbi:hypothetical protein C8A00DRAFT_44300 [Chaetomidium leptoderma]|uniref:HNH nuclease domain-containing protein n=1 Tax=Chaetomidium leptoderma TaxID=669021 RepID=A0AAN6ZUQ2_9PEZI|nr:hypothetical protein C8A00DRAFT_44300 [Chaetomidium leptoderma]